MALFSNEILAGNNVEFTNLSLEGSPGPATYLWDFDFNNETSADESPSFDYPNTGGTFNVCLTATNGLGSSAPFCLDVELNDLTLGINEIYSSNFKLSPNPTSGLIRLTVEDQSIIKSYKLFSIDGAQIQNSANLTSSGLDMDISTLPKGLYFLEVTTEEHVSMQLPIVKQ